MSRNTAPARCALCALVCLFWAPTSCGGSNDEPRPTATDGPALGQDPFNCAAGDGYDLQMLQDFEKGIATDFYTNADGTEDSEVSPAVGSSSPASAEIEGGRCGSSGRAFQMTGSGLRIWGMVFGWNFRDGARDLSDWEGVSFWARKGSSESGSSLFFSVFDPGTDTSGGRCDANSDVLAEKCDSYGTGIGLDEEWRFFRIPFSSLHQRGFGVATEELLTDQVIGFNWAADRGDWDVWVDDVALFRAKGDGIDSGGAGGAAP